MDSTSSIRNTQLATPDVVHPHRVGGFRTSVRDDAKHRYFVFFRRQVPGHLLDVTANLRLGDSANGSVLGHDIEHQGNRPLRPDVEVAGQVERALEHLSGMLDLYRLELTGPAQRPGVTQPRFVDAVRDGVLDRSCKRDQFFLAVRALAHLHCFSHCSEIRPENRLRDVGVRFNHFLKQGLQRTLPEIPLQHAEADALFIEVTGNAAETFGWALASFKCASQSDTALIQSLAGERRWRRIG